MSDIFISYSREDEKFALELARDMQTSGIEVWIDQSNIRSGDRWRRKIQQALDSCRLLLLIITPSAMASDNVEYEWQTAWESEKPLIPILYKPTEEIDFPLSGLHYIDFTSQVYELALSELKSALQEKGITHPLYGELFSLATREEPQGDEVRRAKALLLGEFRNYLQKGQDRLNNLIQLLIDYVTRDLAGRCAGNSLLIKVHYWLEDDLILVYPKTDAYIDDLSKKLSRPPTPHFVLTDLQLIPPTPPTQPVLFIDIEFKSEYVRSSKTDHEGLQVKPISLVAQCMLVICHKTGFFFTVHDRSYAGADDRLSKYSMITGRLRAKDLRTPMGEDGIGVRALCHNTLTRELQELDELGLSTDLTGTYVSENLLHRGLPRTQFVNVYEAQDRQVLSFLYSIFVTVDEYNNDLTNRGPYLLPVTPTEFSKLRTLNLLNDILLRNSCSVCLGDGNIPFRCQHPNEPKPCIIRDILELIHDTTFSRFTAFDKTANRDKNIITFRTPLGCESVIIAIDIPDYSSLNIETTQAVRTELDALMNNFLSGPANYAQRYDYWIQSTAKGYIIVLRTDDSQHAINRSGLALIAYFFSLYLSASLKDTRLWQEEEGQDIILPYIRIGLHTDNLVPIEGEHGLYFPGNGLNQTLDIVDVGQPQQILCTLGFAMHLLDALENLPAEIFADNDGINGMKVGFGKDSLRNTEMTTGIFTPRQLHRVLVYLQVAVGIIREIMQNDSIVTCLSVHGLPIKDFGAFTQDNGQRFRTFNLGIFYFNEPNLLSYGNVQQPISRIPIIYRTRHTTDTELGKLVSSLVHAEHLMMYGYSNVRMMREIYRLFVHNNHSAPTLKTFKIIFYDFEQYKELNETQSTNIARANWIRGFLYAQHIAQHLHQDGVTCKIGVNSIRYGFNVFKVIYNTDTPTELKDHIRFTVPMPGRAFEQSPIFVINRGDPLYHRFLEICDKYVEEGRKENSHELLVTEYVPNTQGLTLLDRLFIDLPVDINGITESEYNRLCEQVELDAADQEFLHTKLGPHYRVFLREKDFAEAYRLWECFAILNEDAAEDDFDSQRFLAKFLS